MRLSFPGGGNFDRSTGDNTVVGGRALKTYKGGDTQDAVLGVWLKKSATEEIFMGRLRYVSRHIPGCSSVPGSQEEFMD